MENHSERPLKRTTQSALLKLTEQLTPEMSTRIFDKLVSGLEMAIRDETKNGLSVHRSHPIYRSVADELYRALHRNH